MVGSAMLAITSERRMPPTAGKIATSRDVRESREKMLRQHPGRGERGAMRGTQ
jgi:hypothetical protein